MLHGVHHNATQKKREQAELYCITKLIRTSKLLCKVHAKLPTEDYLQIILAKNSLNNKQRILNSLRVSFFFFHFLIHTTI